MASSVSTSEGRVFENRQEACGELIYWFGFDGVADFSYTEFMFGPAARRPLLAALMVLVALVLALGFAGWMRHAGDLLLALGAAGLSWCL